MKNFLQVNRASTGAKTNFYFKWLWTDVNFSKVRIFATKIKNISFF